MRIRVSEAVDAGSSRRGAAGRFGVSASSAIKWFQRVRETGSVAAAVAGGSRSKLEEHASTLLALIADEPDQTLDEVVVRSGEKGIATSRGALWRFFDRHGISFKKKPARQRTGPAGRRATSRPVEEVSKEA